MRKRNGFTLIETLVVVAIFSVVGVSLASSFSMGLRVWKRAAGINVANRKIAIQLERLGQELRQTISYPQIGFWGEEGRVSFAALIRGKLTNVSYYLDPQEKAIYRYSESLQQTLGLENYTLGRAIIPGVEKVSFLYKYFNATSEEYVYLDSWNYSLYGIPLSVTAKIILENGDQFRKVVQIPIARQEI